MLVLVCFFKQKTAYEMRISDWSSDVCSSDLLRPITRATLRAHCCFERNILACCGGTSHIAAHRQITAPGFGLRPITRATPPLSHPHVAQVIASQQHNPGRLVPRSAERSGGHACAVTGRYPCSPTPY